MAVRESAADYTGHRTADARRRRALALVLFALDVIEELRRLLLVVVIEDVRDGEGGDRGELLAGFGVSPQVDVHLGQVEPVEDVLRLQRDGLFEVRLGIAPVAPVQEAATERSEEHTSELQSQSNLVCRLLLEKKKQTLSA